MPLVHLVCSLLRLRVNGMLSASLGVTIQALSGVQLLRILIKTNFLEIVHEKVIYL